MDFDRRVRNAIQEMIKHGYTPTIFLRMIGDHGAVEAVKRLMVKRVDPPKGFLKLLELGCPELSMESIITNEPEWKELFGEEEMNVARHRLKEAGIK
jgi:hypothetical protein